MVRRILTILFLVLGSALMGSAGTLSGKVSGAKGTSIVYLEPVDTKQASQIPQQQYVINQKDMKFSPDVLVVPVGATVVFKNDDALPHNVNWPSISGDKKLGHNVGTFPAGQQRGFKFDHSGVVPLLCDIHPEMEAYIVVTSTPYYARTEPARTSYQITDVPDGVYKVTAWHPGQKPESKIVSVKGPTTVDFALGG